MTFEYAGGVTPELRGLAPGARTGARRLRRRRWAPRRRALCRGSGPGSGALSRPSWPARRRRRRSIRHVVQLFSRAARPVPREDARPGDRSRAILLAKGPGAEEIAITACGDHRPLNPSPWLRAAGASQETMSGHAPGNWPGTPARHPFPWRASRACRPPGGAENPEQAPERCRPWPMRAVVRRALVDNFVDSIGWRCKIQLRRIGCSDLF